MSAATRWTLIILVLLVGNVAMMGVLVAASSTNRPEIIPGYYDRAVAYDHELDDAERSRALGWTTAATLTRDGIAVDVRDRAGARISDAKVSITGFQRAHAAEALDLGSVVKDGRYLAARTLRAGVYDLQIVVERAGVRFVGRQTVELR